MGKVFNIGYDYPNSRKQELEAVQLGLQLAAKVILQVFTNYYFSFINFVLINSGLFRR